MRALIIKVALIFAAYVLAAFVISAILNIHDAQAHTAQGFSTWKPVTWNDEYVLVRHKHVSTGTICEAVWSNEKRSEVRRFKLVSLNATNHDCVPGDGQG